MYKKGNIESFLEIEKRYEDDLYGFKLIGLHVWPLVRREVLKNYIYSSNYLKTLKPADSAKTYFKIDFIKKFITDCVKIQFKYLRFHDAIFITNNVERKIRTKEGYESYLHGPYFYLFDNPLILERSHYGRFANATKDLKKSVYLYECLIVPLFMIKLLKMKEYVSKKLLGCSNMNNLNKFGKFVGNIFKNDSLGKKTTENFKSVVIFINMVERNFNKFFENDTYKLAFIRSGYGSPLSYVFKRHNYTVIELQHGFVSKEHPDYNFPNISFSSEIKHYFPDYFLMFGNKWAKLINIPNAKVVVGFPYLNLTKRLYQNLFDLNNKKNILILSQGIVTERMIEIANFLSKRLPGYKITLKLHPGEWLYADSVKKKLRSGIKLITNADLYYHILKNSYVIGYNSTALFEAYGLGKKVIFIENDEMSNFKDIGYGVANESDIVDIISTDLHFEEENCDDYWQKNWEDNVRIFFTQIGLSNPKIGQSIRKFSKSIRNHLELLHQTEEIP